MNTVRLDISEEVAKELLEVLDRQVGLSTPAQIARKALRTALGSWVVHERNGWVTVMDLYTGATFGSFHTTSYNNEVVALVHDHAESLVRRLNALGPGRSQGD